MNDYEIEQAIYQKLCSHCPNAKYCHEECENCKEYDEALERALKHDKTEKNI